MRFESILSISPEFRTNLILCFIFVIFCSIQTLISTVRFEPKDRVKPIWTTQQTFVNCFRNHNQKSGTLKWFNWEGKEVEDNQRAPVYTKANEESIRLVFTNAPKKHSGIYECRHSQNEKLISNDSIEVWIFKPINMEGNKDTYVGTEGQTLQISCFAKFDSNSTESQLSWSHNNIPIRNHENQFSITNPTVQNAPHQKTVKSHLTIRNLSKENEGIYECQAVYANPFLTDMKSMDITVRVQFKPSFPENTQKYIWISDQNQTPLYVNVTCIVNADPVASFRWFTGTDREIKKNTLSLKHNIISVENWSVLSLEYKDTNDLRNSFKDPELKHRRFKCRANNDIGNAEMTFEISVGKLPDTPILSNVSYTNGVLQLIVNDSNVEPPIDFYRLEIADKQFIYFNASNKSEFNNTFEIEVEIPEGRHKMRIYAHNPVGWSEQTANQAIFEFFVSSAFVAQQYLGFVLLVSTLSLVNAF